MKAKIEIPEFVAVSRSITRPTKSFLHDYTNLDTVDYFSSFNRDSSVCQYTSLNEYSVSDIITIIQILNSKNSSYVKNKEVYIQSLESLCQGLGFDYINIYSVFIEKELEELKNLFPYPEKVHIQLLVEYINTFFRIRSKAINFLSYYPEYKLSGSCWGSQSYEDYNEIKRVANVLSGFDVAENIYHNMYPAMVEYIKSQDFTMFLNLHLRSQIRSISERDLVYNFGFPIEKLSRIQR